MPALGGNKGKKNTNIQDNDDFDTKNKFEFPGIQRKDSIEEKKRRKLRPIKEKLIRLTYHPGREIKLYQKNIKKMLKFSHTWW